MSYPQISITDVAREVVRLADADPTHIYVKATNEEGAAACFYLPGDHSHPMDPNSRVTAPEGCLFGQALTNLGVSNDDLLGNEGEPVEEVLFHLQITPDLINRTEVEDRMLNTFGDVQSSQDGGAPWGIAVEPLREVLGDLA